MLIQSDLIYIEGLFTRGMTFIFSTVEKKSISPQIYRAQMASDQKKNMILLSKSTRLENKHTLLNNLLP